MNWQRTGYKTISSRKYTSDGEKAICYLLPYFLGSVDDAFSAVRAYFRLLHSAVEERHAVVTLIGSSTTKPCDDVVPDITRDEMTIVIRKSDAKKSSIIIQIVFKQESPRSGFPIGIKLEANGIAKCESCNHDFVRDLMRCAEKRTLQIDPLYFRCGRCRRLQLFVLLRKKLGRDLAKMIVSMAKNVD